MHYTITVKLYGNLKRYRPDQVQPFIMELETGSTVEDLIAQLGIPINRVMRIAINDQFVPFEHAINNGDKIDVIPPIGGG